MNIIEKILGHERAQREREAATQEVVDEGKRQRRSAEAEMIKAYRLLNLPPEKRHEWSKR